MISDLVEYLVLLCKQLCAGSSSSDSYLLVERCVWSSCQSCGCEVGSPYLRLPWLLEDTKLVLTPLITTHLALPTANQRARPSQGFNLKEGGEKEVTLGKHAAISSHFMRLHCNLK